MQPKAPSFLQKSNLDSLETTAIGFAPTCAAIWIAIEPSPPEPPQTSTTSFSRTSCGGQPNSMRYTVEPTRVGAAAASQVRCLALGMHWCACTFVNWANEPQL